MTTTVPSGASRRQAVCRRTSVTLPQPHRSRRVKARSARTSTNSSSFPRPASRASCVTICSAVRRSGTCTPSTSSRIASRNRRRRSATINWSLGRMVRPWLCKRSLPWSRPFVDPKRDRHAIFEPTGLRHHALTRRCRGRNGIVCVGRGEGPRSPRVGSAKRSADGGGVHRTVSAAVRHRSGRAARRRPLGN